MPKIKWLIDNENYSEKEMGTLTNEPFVIDITDKNSKNTLNHILIMKIDGERKLAKYECIVNDTLIVRRHFIRIIDISPRLNVKLEKDFNHLKIGFRFDVKDSSNYNEYLLKPIKMNIMYVENSTFEQAHQKNIAPSKWNRC